MKLGFGEWILDQEAGWLLGPAGEVRLRPHAYRMLEVLAEQAPKILSQEELLDRVWGVEHLSPSSVKQAVSEVRQALGDDAARPAFIETMHRRGYRFIAPVVRIEDAPSPIREPASELPMSIPTVRQSGRRWTALTMPVLASLFLLALVPQPLAEPKSAQPAMAMTASQDPRPIPPFLFRRSWVLPPSGACQDWPATAIPCRPRPLRPGFGPRPRPRPGFHGPPNPLWPPLVDRTEEGEDRPATAAPR